MPDYSYLARAARTRAKSTVPPIKPKADPAPAPKAEKPKPSGPSDDFRAGFAGALKYSKIRAAHVFAAAKANGLEAEGLKLLAETDLDHLAIAKTLEAKASRSLVDAMKRRHGLGGEA
jgi:hypothetical protein